MEKPARSMSVRGFLQKAFKPSVSAAAFLAANREWLSTGDHAGVTAPILSKLDNRELFPTQALNALAEVLVAHDLAPKAKAEKKAPGATKGAQEPTVSRKPKLAAYEAAILDSEGEVQESASFEAHAGSLESQRWADRRLDVSRSDWYATVRHLPTGNVTRIDRVQAIGRLHSQVAGPVTKGPKKSDRLSWGMKVCHSHASFSRG